jgi:WXG100 family type VII secretion target
MQQLGKRFSDWNEYIRDQMMSELRNLSSQLENDWQGVSRQHYDSLLQNWETNIQRLITQGDDMGQHLYRTADRFNQADNS